MKVGLTYRGSTKVVKYEQKRQAKDEQKGRARKSDVFSDFRNTTLVAKSLGGDGDKPKNMQESFALGAKLVV